MQLNTYSRIYLQGENEWQLSSGQRSWRAAGAFDILLKPILKPIVKTPDIAHDDYLLFRMGSSFTRDWGNGTGHHEEGFLSEVGRLPFPHNWQIADRNRIDMRSEGGFSWRYRNRVHTDWSWKQGNLMLEPFSEGEMFYDSRPSQVGRVNWNSGIDVGTGKTVQWEPSLTWRFESQPGQHNYVSYHFRVYLYF